MIHINLLAGGRSGEATWLERARVRWLFDAASVVLVGSSALMVWWFWWLEQRSSVLVAEIRVAQQQTERVTKLLDETKELEVLRERLGQRVSLIEGLRMNQQAAARLLEQVGRTVPDRLWLVELEQRSSDVQIQGRATSLGAVADFVSNLEASGDFASPIEIVESRVEPSVAGDLVKFSLKARFLPRERGPR